MSWGCDVEYMRSNVFRFDSHFGCDPMTYDEWGVVLLGQNPDSFTLRGMWNFPVDSVKDEIFTHWFDS